MSNANEPAFPMAEITPVGGVYSGGGLSKREYVAAAALQGLLASGAGGEAANKVYAAVKYADLLLGALEDSRE